MKLLKSFGYAAHGIWRCIKCETNFRIHTVAAISVAVFAAVYGVTGTQASILTVIIALVFVAELLNTAVEAMVDIISPKRCCLAATAKDCAAGAVLILAAGAVIIAVFTFSDADKLRLCLDFALKYRIFLVLYIVLCACYIFVVPKSPRSNNESKKSTD